MAAVLTRVLHSFVLAMNRLIWRYSPVSRSGFLSSDQLSWVAPLERGFETIRDELDANLLAERERLAPVHEIMGYASPDADGGARWNSYLLVFYGHAFPENWSRCPRTLEYLQRIPGLVSAFVSVLSPGGWLPPHQGAYAGVLRGLFALHVPPDKERCTIRFGEDVRHWNAGECMVFDDTATHEVKNEASGDRVVIYLDVLRPLPWPLSWLNRAMIRVLRHTFFKQPERNYRLWQQRQQLA
ncbi:MAG: aspartyl/asparaginyl beta-hydroxylase domain-containing protein [Planctomycetota bacterium]